MTEKIDPDRITELMRGLEEQAREVDALIERLNRKKADIIKLIEAFEEADVLLDEERSPDNERIKALARAVISENSGEMISTGNEKLDALLLGGIRPPGNIVLRGPPFSGKWIISNSFIAQSIRDGIPVVVLTADRSIKQIKSEVSRLVDGIDEAEEAGLVKFVDAYSRSIQESPGSKYAIAADAGNLSSLIKTVDSVTAEIVKKHSTYRFVLTSLTTFITNNDEKTFLRLLQQFSQKRRTEGAVAFYILEDGIFDQRTYESVNYLMDGAIHLRKTFKERFLRVEGIGDSRSREWIEMLTTDSGFDLGSFTLERIR